MGKFNRNFSTDLIDNLTRAENKLWTKDSLLGDIRKGNVFPAVRGQRIDFYHKGSKLFSFDRGGFKTHIKFASVYKTKSSEDYISQSDLNNIEKISDFYEGYERIKENCSSYAGTEASGVAKIYSKYSYVSSKTNIVVLDIEVSFESADPNKTQDRIDLLFYDTARRQLIFCEAKDFSNSEIWARKIDDLRVIKQIKRYESQIKGDIGATILKEYANYIDVVNKLFGTTLLAPIEIYPFVPLIIFGFDRDQLGGRFKRLFQEKISDQIKYYPIGNITGFKIDNFIKKCKL